MSFEIRPVVAEDIPSLKMVIDSSELFPSEMLDEMISDYLNNPNSEEIWFTYTAKAEILAVGYCTPEKLTEGTFNLLALAVQKGAQGKQIGSKMVSYIEQQLKAAGKRLLLIDTSSAPEYELTRKFYLKNNYQLEATIKDYWQADEDKVIFSKKL